jgi:ketosteroid isomerase-like protein
MGRARYGVREEIKDTAESFYRALSNKNLKAIDAIWAHEPYATVAGVNGQLHQGWSQVYGYWERRFQQLADTRIVVKLTGVMCHAVGDVGWLAGTERRTIARGDDTWHETRQVTAILERRGTSWQMVSYHVSAPAEEMAALANVS